MYLTHYAASNVRGSVIQNFPVMGLLPAHIVHQLVHENDSCTSPSKCINCSGDHPAYSRSCTKWIFLKEVQNIKILCNLSFSEVRRILMTWTTKVGISYIAVTTKSFKSVVVQTDSLAKNPTVPVFLSNSTSIFSKNQSTNPNLLLHRKSYLVLHFYLPQCILLNYTQRLSFSQHLIMLKRPIKQYLLKP